MLSVIFAKVLNMSLTASLVIVLVLFVRLALRKAPKVFSYALWAVVLFRLLCPVSLPAPMSMLGLLNTPVSDTPGLTTVEYTPVRLVPGEPLEFSTLPEQQTPIQTPATAAQPMSAARMFAGIWLVGCAAMAFAGIGSYLRFRLRLAGAVHVRNNIYQVDHMETAFVAGLFRPRIYVPSGLPNNQMRYIVAHEQCHIRRKDHITRHLAFAALCIHWFNPLVWVAFTLSGKDMEMSCDEAVIRRLGDRIRAPYAQSLLNLATNHARIPGTPIAFGEVDTRARIRNIAGWRQPKKWVSTVSMLLCLTTLTACAMNPTQKLVEPNAQNAEVQKQTEPLQETEIAPLRNTDSVSNALDSLKFEIPEGMKRSRISDSQEVFQTGNVTVGGVSLLECEESVFEDVLDFMDQLTPLVMQKLPDAVTETMEWSMGESSLYGLLEYNFGNKTAEYIAYFIRGYDSCYVFWFDRQHISPATEQGIMKSVTSEDIGEELNKISSEAHDAAIGKKIDNGELRFQVLLPDGITQEPTTDGAQFHKDGQLVGGYQTVHFEKGVLPKVQENRDMILDGLKAGLRGQIDLSDFAGTITYEFPITAVFTNGSKSYTSMIWAYGQVGTQYAVWVDTSILNQETADAILWGACLS